MALTKKKVFLLVSLTLSAIVFVAILAIAILIYLVFDAMALPVLDVSPNDSTVNRIKKVDAWLRTTHESEKELVTFNGSVLIMKDQKVLLMKSWGYTDATNAVEIDPQTSMRLASVSKQFTAAAVLVLATQGKIVLDEPVKTYLDSFPYADVTVRHLLNMTSGVPDCYMELAEKHKDELGEVLSIQDVVKLIAKDPPERRAGVNEVYKYSNTSYVLLAALVEVASGQSFEEFTSKTLFEPLEMGNTRVWNLLSEDSSFPNKAGTFIFSENLECGFIDGVAGDGGVFSSVEDFVIWEQFWRGNESVSSELLKQAFQSVKLKDGSVSDYGFGWVTADYGSWHNGSWMGARTYVIRDVKNGLFIVVLDNSSSISVDFIAEQLHEAMRK
ncbi:beta-lactamase family protein [bacterium]|nr:beta-lactamase family protein [bacterium]MDB4458567.1 beta-lactamase family protein [bacterium]